MLIRVSDYIIKKLASSGIKHIFMITGGGAMHLNDAIGRESRIKYVCNHHEQACAIAAEGYARLKGEMAVVCVTSGPGGTNTLTGVLGQWLDSIPVLYLSGQVRYDVTVARTGLPLRQLGDQEANIIEMVRSITKYAVMVTEPKLIRYHLEKATHLAVSGRPGPVWLDIPLDVQASLIEESELKPYDIAEDSDKTAQALDDEKVNAVIERLAKAERPIILAGAGIRLAGQSEAFYQLTEKLGIPVQVAWDAIDLFPSAHPLYAGRPGIAGQRAANFIFQNADLHIILGCRMSLRQIGYNFTSIGRAAYKIAVDIDPNELKKTTYKIDLSIHADVSDFIRRLNAELNGKGMLTKSPWVEWCNERIRRYPVVSPAYYKARKLVNPYAFCKSLSEYLQADDVIVSSVGTSRTIPIKTMDIKYGQRHISNLGCAAMGYGLPAAIGACFANNKRRIICLEGDGSIQFNIQELATVAYHHLRVKIFVFNNEGYLTIRTTQNSFYEGNLVGEGENSGVGLPDFSRVAEAYDIPACHIRNNRDLEKISQIISTDSPMLCVVHMDPAQLVTPRVTSKRLENGQMVSCPLEDMYPFLEEKEFLSNMLIPKWEPKE